MNYIEIVNDTLQYIESNLHRKLSLEELAFRHHISPTHFYRLFRAVTDQTVKSYVLGRKLSEAAVALKYTDCNVMDIAFQYGFNSHEQFTRDFQKMFNITPSRYRKEKISVPLTERIDIIERDFRNKNNTLVVDHCCREIKEIKLLGKEASVNTECSCEMEDLLGKILHFMEEYIYQGSAGRFFGIISSNGSDPSKIFVFYGIDAEEHSGDRSGLIERTIPGSKYAIFKYSGFMLLIFPTVAKDFKKWLSVSGLKFTPNNVGFDCFILRNKDSLETGELYIPVL